MSYPSYMLGPSQSPTVVVMVVIVVSVVVVEMQTHFFTIPFQAKVNLKMTGIYRFKYEAQTALFKNPVRSSVAA